jgi:hypothetical protein
VAVVEAKWTSRKQESRAKPVGVGGCVSGVDRTNARQQHAAETNDKKVERFLQRGRELSRGTMTRRLELHGAGTPSSRRAGLIVLWATQRV